MTDPPAEQRALAAGRAAFGDDWRPELRATAPGRLELLGNHLDYNGGPVLAAAIDRTVVVLADSKGDPGIVEAVAADVDAESVATIDVTTLRDWRNPSPPPAPLDYLRGTIAGLLARSELTTRPSLRMTIAGDVPIGFGLSSSAALCVALALVLAETPGDARATVLLAQEAEHRAGTPCGTMDQSTSVAGGVIRFDAANLNWETLHPDLGDLVFAVADSGVQRSLAASSYPQRVEESKQVLALANAVLPVPLPHLAELTADQLTELERLSLARFPEPLRKRARHIVSETTRVAAGVEALRTGDWRQFGALMTASGHSSATDYEISHPLVEELVAASLRVDGVLGARMMGGGEGGVVLILLPRSVLPALADTLQREYFARHGLRDPSTSLQVCTFGPGAHVAPFTPGA